MLQTKKITGTDKVAVSSDPTAIYIRNSGKQYFGKEELLVSVKDGVLTVNMPILKRHGFTICFNQEEGI